MIFASKSPADLNRDPHPYVWDGHSPLNAMRADTDMYRRGAPCSFPGYSRRPRPEFDGTQTNAPNPILLTLREAPADMRLWAREHLIDALTYDIAVPELYRAPVRDATPAQRAHALRVLNRLADLDTLAERETTTC